VPLASSEENELAGIEHDATANNNNNPLAIPLLSDCRIWPFKQMLLLPRQEAIIGGAMLKRI
jgi:hypothetical protein